MIRKDLSKKNATAATQGKLPSELDRLIAAGHSLATTAQAANYLNINPQTLRKWACYQTGALQPVRVGRHLRWRLIDIAALIKGATK